MSKLAILLLIAFVLVVIFITFITNGASLCGVFIAPFTVEDASRKKICNNTLTLVFYTYLSPMLLEGSHCFHLSGEVR